MGLPFLREGYMRTVISLCTCTMGYLRPVVGHSGENYSRLPVATQCSLNLDPEFCETKLHAHTKDKFDLDKLNIV